MQLLDGSAVYLQVYADVLCFYVFSCALWLVPNVVLASSLDTFKNRLDRFWGNQDVKYVYTAELTGAGSRSEFYMI